MSRPVRLALAAVAAAAMLAPLGAAAAASASAQPAAPPRSAAPPSATHYCARYDAYELRDCAPLHRLPPGPLGRQLAWVLDNLAGAATLTVDQVRAHLTAGLQQVQPAEAVLEGFRSTLADRGPMRFVGFSYPPRSDQALAIVRSASGARGVVAIGVDGALIETIGVEQAPPTLVPRGRYNGWFDVGGGRRLFLRCTGTGSPTVVFDNGLTTDWYDLQNQLSPLTRVCSYDPARQAGPLGRSDPAPGPRTGLDRVSDLHALLAAARVPGPYVLAGHSNGGLFSLLYSSRHPEQVAGMVLIDGVHPDYHRRSIEVAKQFVPRQLWDELEAAACGIPPVQVDAELMDICRAEAQTRAALAAHPLHRIPLTVITRGGEHFSPGSEPDAQERLWRQLQNELAATQPDSSHVIATRSGHDIQHEQPELVLAQVRRVVAAARAS